MNCEVQVPPQQMQSPLVSVIDGDLRRLQRCMQHAYNQGFNRVKIISYQLLQRPAWCLRCILGCDRLHLLTRITASDCPSVQVLQLASRKFK